MLCKPAKASGFDSLHGTASIRQDFSWPDCLESKLVAVNVNQLRKKQSRYHLDNSAHVFVLSWVSVLAVTTPRVSAAVHIAHKINHETKQLLPIPCPEATAIRSKADFKTEPYSPPFASSSRVVARISLCQARGRPSHEVLHAPSQKIFPRTKEDHWYTCGPA